MYNKLEGYLKKYYSEPYGVTCKFDDLFIQVILNYKTRQ